MSGGNGNIRRDPATQQLQYYGGVGRVHQMLDKAAENVQQRRGGAPLCVEGCGLCCTHNVPSAMMVEAGFLVGRTPMASAGEKSLVQRSLDWLQEDDPRLSREPLPLDRGLSPAQRGRLQSDHAVIASGKCPLLNPDLTCSVHPNRPFVCRGYGAVASPDPWCKRPLFGAEKPERRLVVHPQSPIGQFVQGSVDGLFAAMQRDGRSDMMQVGFLPTQIARILAPQAVADLARAGRIHPAKLGVGVVKPDLFLGVR